jgi:hypothetical protein
VVCRLLINIEEAQKPSPAKEPSTFQYVEQLSIKVLYRVT